MRRIGIESGVYSENAYLQIAADGFEAVDESLADTEDGVYLLPAAEWERVLSQKRKAAEDAGIVISQTHGPWRYPPRDASSEDRAERMEKMKKCLYATRLLGCRYMAIHPIMPFGADMPDNDKPLRDKMVDMNREFFADLIREAERQNVVICFENMPMLHLPLASAADTAAFIREFDSEYFKMCLDTGHCRILGEEPSDAVRRDADIIRILHVHDNNGRNDFHWLPYHGVIDWNAFRESLSCLDDNVVMSLECGVPKKMPEPIRTVCRKALCDVARYLAGRENG